MRRTRWSTRLSGPRTSLFTKWRGEPRGSPPLYAIGKRRAWKEKEKPDTVMTDEEEHDANRIINIDIWRSKKAVWVKKRFCRSGGYVQCNRFSRKRQPCTWGENLWYSGVWSASESCCQGWTRRNSGAACEIWRQSDRAGEAALCIPYLAEHEHTLCSGCVSVSPQAGKDGSGDWAPGEDDCGNGTAD